MMVFRVSFVLREVRRKPVKEAEKKCLGSQLFQVES
jgi:hypothetical protein